jgi:hypothetical protein
LAQEHSIATGGVSGDAPEFSAREKQQALEAVLGSETFAHSVQLRSFLRYVCEMEIAGRAGEISEYVIGVGALGRPEGYSLTEDASVRKRAYELRHKLEKFYSAESPSAPIRIEIPKGSYVPRFLGRGTEVVEQALELAPEPIRVVRTAGFPWLRIALLMVACITVGVVADRVAGPAMSGRSSVDPILAEAWGPMAQPGADVVICIATNLHLLVRPHSQPETTPVYPAFPELYPLFRQHRPLAEGTPLQMQVADSSVTFGEVWAANLTGSTLKSFRAEYQMVPERVAPYPALRNRNAVVIGVPMDSDAVSTLLARTPYTIEYDASAGDQAVRDRRKPAGAPPAFATEAGRPSYAYGLVTVLPSEGSAAGRRCIVFSGIGSVGAHGAAEFFSSPEHLRDFKATLKKLGDSRFPSAYQVVVKCKQSQNLLISSEYAAHAIIR